MPAKDVVSLYNALDRKGIKIWIDGGWAIDALLGEQTRDHEDLDIAIQRKDLDNLKDYFESQGYREIKRDENKMWDLIMKDASGHEIETHAFSFNESGEIIAEKYWDGYSANSLSGIGTIVGQEIRCVSIEQIVKTHNGSKRKLKETDYRDMATLSQKFGVKFLK